MINSFSDLGELCCRIKGLWYMAGCRHSLWFVRCALLRDCMIRYTETTRTSLEQALERERNYYLYIYFSSPVKRNTHGEIQGGKCWIAAFQFQTSFFLQPLQNCIIYLSLELFFLAWSLLLMCVLSGTMHLTHSAPILFTGAIMSGRKGLPRGTVSVQC